MSKYTPGPWKSGPTQSNERGIPSIEVRSKDWVICEVWDDYKEVPGQENAKLIALSPTMYEYIKTRADNGDEDAANIIANL